MSRGLLVGVLLVAWVVTGWAVAVYVARRGHFLPAWLVLGTVFGPFTISLWRSSRDRHVEARPRAIDAGRPGPGPVNVLVGIDGSPESRAALVAAVDLLGDRLGRVTVATVLEYDTVLDTIDRAAELDRRRAVPPFTTRLLSSSRLWSLVPTEVTLVGRACEALRDYAVDNDCSLLVVGPGRNTANLDMLDRVTVFLGGSPNAEAIMPAATQWAARMGAERRLVSVVSSDATVFDLLEVSAASRGSERLDYLERLHDPDSDQPTTCSVVFAHRVADAIIDELLSLPAVGALTTHRRSDVACLILGGVALGGLSRGATPLLLAPVRK